ncbi:putative L-PSP endoribonuclease family protein [Stachybotrys elegans]|uniref:L-PSP endoribonuclease family protein n=1 Tax=Stachybotrys elegans TaxID=80388 RepID=A0A8K0SF02_9HYPO|nr:putative L-PSP endoribonuclease family protein [Stachybotrys elegans]
MSSLTYHNYPKFGDYALEHFAYNQAVRVGDRIELSGQGGWDPNSDPLELAEDLEGQIDQAFRNIDLALKVAGGKGLSQVYKIVSYHVHLGDDVMLFMKKNFIEWFPDHKPIWTAVGVERLALPQMKIEIEAVAYDP